MGNISYRSIGEVHSPYTTAEENGDWGALADMRGEVRIDPEYADGLYGLESFEYVVLVAHMHRVDEPILTVDTHRMENRNTLGVFASRSAQRPNPIGVTVVHLLDVDGTRLEVEDLDLADETPVLDVKPYVRHHDRDERADSGPFGAIVDR